MPTISVTRMIEYVYEDLGNGIYSVFSRWSDQHSKFRHSYMTKEDLEIAEKLANDTKDFSDSRIRSKYRTDRHNKYDMRVVAYSNEFIDNYNDTGSFNFYTDHYTWEPKKFGEKFPKNEYTLYLFSSYDHFIVTVDDQLLDQYTVNEYFTQSSGWDVYNLNKYLEENSESKGFKLLETGYCPGNGLVSTITFYIEPEEYLDLMKKGESYHFMRSLKEKFGLNDFYDEDYYYDEDDDI